MLNGQSRLSEGRMARRLNIFEVFVENYSPDYGPMRAGFCAVKDGICTPFAYKDAGKDCAEWAASYLKHLQKHAGLESLKLRYLPVGAQASDDKAAPKTAQEKFWAEILGGSMVFFEADLCTEPGYLSSLAARSFSQKLLSLKPLPLRQDDVSEPEILQAAAGFLGLGLAGLKPGQDGAEMPDAIFSSALFLAVKGYTVRRFEQIYSGELDVPVMAQMRESFDVLDAYKPRIEHMRNQIINAQNGTYSPDILSA